MFPVWKCTIADDRPNGILNGQTEEKVYKQNKGDEIMNDYENEDKMLEAGRDRDHKKKYKNVPKEIIIHMFI